MTTGTMTTGTMTTAPVNPALQAIDPARLHDVVQKLIDQMRVPGAVVQLRTPQGNFTVAVGTTDLDTQTPPAADTHFRIASNTKTLTAALIMLLAQDGKLRLTDPVSTTYQMCPMAPTSPSPSCSMRSGLSNYTADSEFAATLDTDPPRTGHLTRGWRSPSGTRRSSRPARSTTTTTPTTRCWVWLPRRPVAANWPTSSRIGCSAQWVCTSRRCRRGRCWRHSGAVLARIHVRRNVLRARRRSLSRRPPGGGPVPELRPVDYTQQNSSYATAAGGAISTADDLATWIRALVSGQGVRRRRPEAMAGQSAGGGSRAPDGRSMATEFRISGSVRTRRCTTTAGKCPASTLIGYDPDNDVTLVIWTNLTLDADGRTTANAMLPAILVEIYSGLSLTSTTPTATR
jgi:D-alanyl-D-alanine carboxypeptidase